MPRKGGSLRREQQDKRYKPLDVKKWEKELNIRGDSEYAPDKKKNNKKPKNTKKS